MSQFSHEDPSHITELVEAAESYDQQKVQEILLEMTKNAPKPTDPILHLVNNPEIPYGVRLFAVNFFPGFYKRRSDEYDGDIEVGMLTDISNVISPPKMEYPDCDTIWRTLFESLEKKDPKFKKEYMLLVKSKLLHRDLENLRSSLYLITILIQNISRSEKSMLELFDLLFEDVVAIGKGLVESMIEEIPKNSETFAQELNFKRITKMLKIMNLWITIINKFGCFREFMGRGFSENTRKLLRTMFQDGDLATTAFKILKLDVNTDGQIKNCLFSTSNNEKVDDLMIKIKAEVLQYFEIASRMSNRTDFDEHSSMSLKPELNKANILLHNEGLEFLFESLYGLCRESYLSLENDSDSANCLKRCIILIELLVPHIDLDDLLPNKKELLIINACLPLLASNERDLSIFNSDNSEFLLNGVPVELEDDNGNIKNQVARLIAKLCETQGGTSVFIVDLVVALLDLSLSSQDQTIALYEQYPILQKYRESPIINTWEPKMRIEVCLVALRCLSDQISQREDLLRQIETVLAKHSESLISKHADPLLKTQICLFLAVFISKLFKNNEQLSQHCIRFLTNCIDTQEGLQRRVVSQAATEAFSTITSEKGSLLKILPYLADIANELMLLIPQSKIRNLLDVMTLLAPFIVMKEPDVVIPLAKLLVEKMHMKWREDKTERESSFIINKLWKFINEIVNKKDKCSLFRTELEDILEPFFIDGITEGWDIDDEIVSFLNTTIEKTSSLSPLCWKVLDILPKIVDKYNGMFPPICTFMAKIIFWGKNEVQSNPEIITSLISMGLKGLNSQHPDVGDAFVSHVSTVFQTLIEHIAISDTNLTEILDAFCQRLVNRKEKSFVKIRFGGVFAFCFEKNFELTQNYLTEKNALETVVDLFSSEVVSFSKHPYDRKAFVVGVTALLTQEKLDPLILEKLTDLLNILISFLTYLYQEQSSKGQKTSPKISLQELISEKNQRKDNDDDDEEEEEDACGDSDEDNEDSESESENESDNSNGAGIGRASYFPTEKDEANFWLKGFIPFRMHIDEFERFRGALKKLKTNDLQLFQELMSGLSDNKRNLLKEALKIKNVIVDSQKGKTEFRKIIKARNMKIHFG